jgi:hypothetical protein
MERTLHCWHRKIFSVFLQSLSKHLHRRTAKTKSKRKRVRMPYVHNVFIYLIGNKLYILVFIGAQKGEEGVLLSGCTLAA